MTLISQIKNLLHKYNMHLAKSLGQHFLADPEIYDIIVKASTLTRESHVLEIGAGFGFLTERLATIAKKVISVEIDPKCVEILKDRLSYHQGLKIINADIRRLSLPELCPIQETQSLALLKWIVVANIPYYLSSFIIRKFLDNSSLFSYLILMLQKEVAERLTAKPGAKSYSLLSVITQALTSSEIVCYVHPSAFFPPPQIESAVIKLTINPSIPQDIMPIFIDLARQSFAKRRKTLKNNLRGFKGILYEDLEKLANNCGIDLRQRGETLSVTEFAYFAHAIKKFLGN